MLAEISITLTPPGPRRALLRRRHKEKNQLPKTWGPFHYTESESGKSEKENRPPLPLSAWCAGLLAIMYNDV